MNQQQQHSNSISHPFFTPQNRQLLWNLIYNEYQLSNNSQAMHIYKQGITDIFNSNMSRFESNVLTNNDPIITINKTFLSQVNTAIRNIFPDIRDRLKEQTRIQAGETTTPILYQDIQEKRQRQFQQQMDEKQNEFNQAHAKPQPPEPINMTDNIPENRDPKSFQEQLTRMRNERGYDAPPSASSTEFPPPSKKVSWEDETNKINTQITATSSITTTETSSSSSTTDQLPSKNMLMLVLQNTSIILEQLQTIIEMLKSSHKQE